MARFPRYVIPGQPQHIIQRGNNRQVIFAAEADFQFFRDALVDAAGKHGLAIHAYANLSCLTPFTSTEDHSFGEGLFTSKPLVGGGVGETRLLGAFLNSVSKVHDWMNQTLTGVYDANPISATYGGALPGSALRGIVIDAISTAGMIPAAAFTARALYNNPLRVKSK